MNIYITQKLKHIQKIITLILSLTSLNCYSDYWPNFESLEKCLTRHQEAFKKFEPEAPQVKVDTNVKVQGTTIIRTKTYSPLTPNLSEYLGAALALKNKLKTKAITKGILLGALLGVMNACLIDYKVHWLEKLNDKVIASPLILFCINPMLVSIGAILLENKSVKNPEPYFGLENLKKSENIFSMNIEAFERIMLATSASFWVQVISTPVSAYFLNNIKSKKLVD